MVWGEEAVRRREEMTEPPEWPTEVSERSEFRREEYRDLPGPDPKRNVDHPDLGYLAVADRNWPRGEDGTCSGREWGWDIERGATLTPTFRLYVCFLSHPASFLFRVSLQHPLVSSPLSRETIHFSGL